MQKIIIDNDFSEIIKSEKALQQKEILSKTNIRAIDFFFKPG